jgi:hypothetical protein
MSSPNTPSPRMLPRAPPAPVLRPNENWQTASRGTNSAEYDIYVTNAQSLGWPVKSFDEWLAP